MGLFSKEIETMDDLFVHQLEDIYYAEKRIVGALPEMITKATSPQLQIGLRIALWARPGITSDGSNRCSRCTVRSRSRSTCPAIDGIIKEAEEVAGEVEDKNVLDAALIAAAQAVEHYEMTRYGTLIAWAKTLGRNDCARCCEETLAEEEAADKKLTKIAEGGVNRAGGLRALGAVSFNDSTKKNRAASSRPVLCLFQGFRLFSAGVPTRAVQLLRRRARGSIASGRRSETENPIRRKIVQFASLGPLGRAHLDDLGRELLEARAASRGLRPAWPLRASRFAAAPD